MRSGEQDGSFSSTRASEAEFGFSPQKGGKAESWFQDGFKRAWEQRMHRIRICVAFIIVRHRSSLISDTQTLNRRSTHESWVLELVMPSLYFQMTERHSSMPLHPFKHAF